jgi:2-oxoglutarate dehydrogenase E2 component (dihydrolipoamide succinyltransferase)
MTTKILVPAMGESVSEATIAKWFKQPGEAITVDQPLVELETDKVTVEVNAPSSGVLSEISSPVGSTVAVGAVLGLIESSGVPIKASPEPKVSVGVDSKETNVKVTPEKFPPAPSAQKMMTEHKLDLSSLSGTGKDGRVTKADVIQKLEQPLSSSIHQTQEARENRVKMTRLRKRIAERLKEAQNTAAMLTTFNEVDMSALNSLRSQYKDSFEKKHNIKLGFMSFFVKAVVTALKEWPSVNAEIDGDDVVYKNYYDIGVAVGTPNGLVVPVLRNADHLSFAGIEQAIANYGRKARDGKLSMEDMMGGTFTISNGGVYGSLMSTPILNPPQSGILGMHKTQMRPVVLPDGKIEARPMMYLALSYDHRIIDGREAVSFLVRVKECIEDPQRILLDM